MKRTTRTILNIFLIVLYLNYYACSTFFVHTHYTSNGPITHSHPYTGPHNHSATAYVTISVLSAIIFYVVPIVFATFIICKFQILKTRYRKYKFHFLLTHLFLRAPPALE